jgi:hypothetical protein
MVFLNPHVPMCCDCEQQPPRLAPPAVSLVWPHQSSPIVRVAIEPKNILRLRDLVRGLRLLQQADPNVEGTRDESAPVQCQSDPVSVHRVSGQCHPGCVVEAPANQVQQIFSSKSNRALISVVSGEISFPQFVPRYQRVGNIVLLIIDTDFS